MGQYLLISEVSSPTAFKRKANSCHIKIHIHPLTGSNWSARKWSLCGSAPFISRFTNRRSLRLNERRKRDYKARETIPKAKDRRPAVKFRPGHDDEARREQVPTCLPRRRASHASPVPSRKRLCADLGRGDCRVFGETEPAQIIPIIAREFVIRSSFKCSDPAPGQEN